MTTRTFCTILSTNYLPKALALGESLRRHEDGATLRILFIDVARDEDLPSLPGVECLSTARLGLSARRVRELAMSYDLVELATAVKPLLLAALLEESDQAFYLDPDTYLVAPMVELTPALEASPGGILLTPHFLGPPPPGADHSDGHLLLVGVNNLGFCGVDRRAGAALDWWWSHLETECLYDPLAGLFVDQKWMDIGSSHYQAASFRHPGYNVSVANLWERPLAAGTEGYRIASTGRPLAPVPLPCLRLERAREVVAAGTPTPTPTSSRTTAWCSSSARSMRPSCPPTRRASRPHRRTRTRPTPVDGRSRASCDGRTAGSCAGAARHTPLPSPFEPSEAAAYERWRRRAWRPIARGLLAEGAKCVRIVLPEEYDRLTTRFPRLGDALRDRFSGGEGSWG